MSTATAPDNRVAKREALDPKPTPPVHIWATLGAALLVFEAYVVVKWVSGPYFQQVHSGPTSPPSWMKFAVNTVQIAVPVGCVVWTYWFLWRPWKRERRFTFEGLFTVAIFISSIYDPLSDYFQTWFTYNSYFFNRGNAMEALPGWMSISRPGEMVAWPLIFIPPTYVLLIGGVAILGSSVMRRVRRRWPALSAIPLVLSCYLFMMAFDFVLEGLIGLRLGLWEYEGGTGALSPDKFYKYPISEMFIVSAVLTAFSAMWFFRNDHGQTMAERGVETTVGWRAVLLRFLAILAVSQVFLVVFYHLPSALISVHETSWPAAAQSRSYLTNHLCGAGTDRACPGPEVPIARSGSVYLGPSGQLIVPSGTRLPRPVPFQSR